MEIHSEDLSQYFDDLRAQIEEVADPEKPNAFPDYRTFTQKAVKENPVICEDDPVYLAIALSGTVRYTVACTEQDVSDMLDSGVKVEWEQLKGELRVLDDARTVIEALELAGLYSELCIAITLLKMRREQW